LLREVNHRVKNNLTAIIGLLYTARRYAQVRDQETYRETMNELISRVQGLTTVHDMLSASEWSPLRLSDLASRVIRASLQALPRHKRMSVDVPPSPVRVTPNQAHHLALVLNELTTNSAKYALQERDTARIAVRIAQDDDIVSCEFQDNGPGYPTNVLNLEQRNVGFDLIQNIVRDNLRGELSLHNDQGAKTLIQFKTTVNGQQGEQ
jgi:two-component sensor histidine kinase